MRKRTCCLCHRTGEAGRWSQTPELNGDEVVHGLCPTCFAETREKVRRIYAPLHREMAAEVR